MRGLLALSSKERKDIMRQDTEMCWGYILDLIAFIAEMPETNGHQQSAECQKISIEETFVRTYVPRDGQ